MTGLMVLIGLFLYGLIIGLLAPGLLIVLGLEYFFHFSFNRELKLFIEIVTSVVPWIILVISIRANKKKRTVFVIRFILMYTVCGAVCGLVYILWLMFVVGT
jgi:hypothetical protein